MDMSKQDSSRPSPQFQLDPGAFNAALFEAYKGSCDCAVCQILRDAVEASIAQYLPGKKVRGPKGGGA